MRSAATTDGRVFPVLVDEQLSDGLPWCRVRGGYGRGVAAVLLVEDDETIGRVLAASLGVHGHAAVWVTTGAAGLAAPVVPAAPAVAALPAVAVPLAVA